MAPANPLLPLFKEQLEAEGEKIAKTHNLEIRGHVLIYWYFTRLLDFSEAEVAEVFCDGGGDLGIDAIWIDDEDLVHFYQFKHPEDSAKGIAGTDVDKMISGLRLILLRRHDQIANPELRARLDEVYQQVPKGYRIHLVSSGGGVSDESRAKLNAFCDELKNPSQSIVEWDEQPLTYLQELFYEQNLPAVSDPLKFDIVIPPYMLRSGSAECYMFSVPGHVLARLYNEHKEGLLQRNIRVDQGDTATNRSIEETCSSSEPKNFLHFNNGITFLCEKAVYDAFQRTLTLDKAQVVNGGQTIRAIHRAFTKTSLNEDVVVPVRAITSSGDKDFANNVAVNQNNQNQVGTGFLRSNDKLVVQLDHALASHGWYLERREGELKNMTPAERAAVEHRIGQSLEGRCIRLKEGAQAYTSTFYGQPEIAKKNVKKIFLSVDDGGYYERIFSIDMTAEKVIIAHQLKAFVDEFVRDFAAARRKFQADDKAGYENVLGKELTSRHSDVIHQVMPQCVLFVCGSIFRDLTELQKKDPSEITAILQKEGTQLVRTTSCISSTTPKAIKIRPTGVGQSF
jgi:hypothetical protein